MDYKAIFAYLEGLNLDSVIDHALDQKYESAQQEKIPALRPQSCRLLYLLLKMRQPKTILEIGTGSGLSGLWMLKACPDSAFVSLERDKKRFYAAQELFQAYTGFEVLNQDVFQFLEHNQDTYDCIFMDAQKRDYIELLPLLETHCNNNTLLITDNILFGGKVVQEILDDERKYRSGVDRLKQFNLALTQSPRWESFSLALEDGITLALYRNNP